MAVTTGSVPDLPFGPAPLRATWVVRFDLDWLERDFEPDFEPDARVDRDCEPRVLGRELAARLADEEFPVAAVRPLRGAALRPRPSELRPLRLLALRLLCCAISCLHSYDDR